MMAKITCFDILLSLQTSPMSVEVFEKGPRTCCDNNIAMLCWPPVLSVFARLVAYDMLFSGGWLTCWLITTTNFDSQIVSPNSQVSLRQGCVVQL